MIKKNAIFKNLFSNHTITPQRMYNFGTYVLTALRVQNKNGEYTGIISELQTVLPALNEEICNIDCNMAEQVNSTRTVDEYMGAFVEFMKDIEPVIARAVGGRKSPAYCSFYPHSVMEYDKVNKSNFFLFTGRIHSAAADHSAALGDKLTGELQAFKEDIDTARAKQCGQMASAVSNRNKRNHYFVQAQWILTAAVHQVAYINRSNIAASNSIFPFETLYPQARRKTLRLTGVLAAGERREITIPNLIIASCITVRNKSGNAVLQMWIGNGGGEEAAPDSAPIVQALSNKKMTAAMLKESEGTKLVVCNVSGINPALYEIIITGLKKETAVPLFPKKSGDAKEADPDRIVVQAAC